MKWIERINRMATARTAAEAAGYSDQGNISTFENATYNDLQSDSEDVKFLLDNAPPPKSGFEYYDDFYYSWRLIDKRIETLRTRKQRAKRLLNVLLVCLFIVTSAGGYAIYLFRPHVGLKFNGDERFTSTFRTLLPDHSEIVLNRNSSFDFMHHPLSRNLKLKGRAYMNVSNSYRPFFITAGETELKTYKASFFVSVEPEQVTIHVSDGEVHVLDDEHPVVVHTGENITLIPGDYPMVSTYRRANYNAWFSGNLVFPDEYLRQVVNTLQSEYHVVIRFSEPGIGRCRFSGIFHEIGTIQDVLKILCESMNLQYVTDTDGSFVISGPTCSSW